MCVLIRLLSVVERSRGGRTPSPSDVTRCQEFLLYLARTFATTAHTLNNSQAVHNRLHVFFITPVALPTSSLDLVSISPSLIPRLLKEPTHVVTRTQWLICRYLPVNAPIREAPCWCIGIVIGRVFGESRFISLTNVGVPCVTNY